MRYLIYTDNNVFTSLLHNLNSKVYEHLFIRAIAISTYNKIN